MKSIRNIALSALLSVGAFTTITYTACTQDECKDVVCQNGGACVSGNCNCTTGYEGTSCETEVRAKFVKTWTASDKDISSGKDLSTYNSNIVNGSGILDVKVSNFSGLFVSDVKATVSGNTITISSQEPDADGYYVEGTGTYNSADGTISWTYTITSPQNAKKSYTGSWKAS